VRLGGVSLAMTFAVAIALGGCAMPPPSEAPASDAPNASADAQSDAPKAGGLLGNGSVVDGIRVGEPFDCPATRSECATRLTLAAKAAMARHGLAPVAIGPTRFYMPYLQPGAANGGGGGAIVVFDLREGSQAAIYTVCFDGCFVVDPQPVAPETLAPAVDHGPLVDPFVETPVDCRSAEHPRCNEAVKVAIAAATERGIVTPDTIAAAHYYVTSYPAGSPEATALKGEYLVDVYVAGPHGPTAEVASQVTCASGSCQALPSAP